VGVRTCLHLLTIISSSNSCVSYSYLLDSIGFSHISYPTRSSVDKQENTNKEITSKACKTSIGNQSILDGLVLLGDGLVY